jgi:hypothetical protein
MTKGAIITDLKNLIGPGIEVSDGGLLNWVNDAYMQMVDEIVKVNPDFFAKSATADTVNAQQEYELPADFDKALMVNVQIDGEWKRALPLPNINFVPIHARTDSAQGYSWADPKFYIINGNIGLMPIPDESGNENIKLWYIYTPLELSADADVPAIPSKFHHIIKYGAYSNYLDQDDEHAAAERMRIRFDALVQRMVESMVDRQIDEPKSVEITSNRDLYIDETQYV